MKKLILIPIVLSAALFCLSCEEEEEPVNILPTCTITSPNVGDEIVQGTKVIVSVEASDSDGDIKTIILKIDDDGICSENEVPYKLEWEVPVDYSIGSHYIKAIAIDDLGGTTIDEVLVTISPYEKVYGTLTDIDGNTYKTVKIGDQWWMAENLKVTHCADSTEIPLVTDNSVWSDHEMFSSTGAYCFYDNDEANSYGALYTSAVAYEACPAGWHLPSSEEWISLVTFLGMDFDYNDYYYSSIDPGIEGALMLNDKNWDGNDIVGFAALPGGFRSSDGIFKDKDYRGYWWCSSGNPFVRDHFTLGFSYEDEISDENNIRNSCGLSVRCVQD